VNPDARTPLYKSGRQRCENGSGVVARGLNAQGAERSGLDVSPLGDIIVQSGEHLEALLKQSLAGLGQYQAMGRAVEKAEPQRLLQLLHPLADDRWRCAQFGGSLGKAPALRDPHERVELVQVPQHCGKRHLAILWSRSEEIRVQGMVPSSGGT
jgi:hypothetical protein